MLKAFKKDILLAMKQGQKFQKQTMGISLQYVIIVVKNITLKNLLSQKEKDIFVVVIVTQNIELNCCPKKNNTLLTLPAGTLDVQVQDNVGAGCVIQFYILLNSIKPICNAMMQQMGIDKTSPEWTKTVDTFLGMIKNEMVG